MQVKAIQIRSWMITGAVSGALLLGSLGTAQVAVASEHMGHGKNYHHGGGGYGMSPERWEKMAEYLNFSDEQKAQLEEVMKDARTKMSGRESMHKAMRDYFINVSPDDPEFMARTEAFADQQASIMKAHMLEMAQIRKDVYAIMTPEQKTRWREKMATRMEKHMGKGSKGKHHWGDDY